MTHEHVNSRFYVCMYVCMYVCVYMFMYICMYAFMYERCMYNVYDSKYALLIYACMYPCMYVCMYVCMYASGSEIKVTRVVVASNGNHCFDNFLAFAPQVLKPNRAWPPSSQRNRYILHTCIYLHTYVSIKAPYCIRMYLVTYIHTCIHT